jgi:hypothetical protein
MTKHKWKLDPPSLKEGIYFHCSLCNSRKCDFYGEIEYVTSVPGSLWIREEPNCDEEIIRQVLE